ncbi:DUF881 domain-containing protein [Tomitella fengzijianii]|uniref:DUF881 domain-containing protein n=1 Tax=Tomitella fengzijianii TaxID=2597660 RepID=A0A516X7X3_9ACTN|nr:DUF881 domain-containing protein [Tomitella fengzijianii]QDQ99172.1 DUF881 domain-containing protein [Tomitella fengzijianii]
MLAWPGRSSRVSAVLVALLCMLLGVAIATQVRDTGSGDWLDSARPADLLVVLDNLHGKEAALRQEISGLEQSLQSMQSAGSDSREALAQSRQQLAALQVLVGVAPAEGPGVVVEVTDPRGGVDPSVLLDLLQELRAAGAEVIAFSGAGDGDDVRVGVDTAVTGTAGAVVVDGVPLRAPYTVKAIGDGPTMAAALNIPGGVQDTVRRASGDVTVTTEDLVRITAVRKPEAPQNAQPGD